jgi:hypothetical protein
MNHLSPKTKRRSQRGFAGSTRGRARPARILWNHSGSMFEVLEDRRLLSTLDITSGSLTYDGTAAASDLTVSTTGPSGAYRFTDADQTITLTAAAMTAGWTGSGTNSVTGPDSSVTGITITTGAADDTISINSVDASTFIDSGAGSDAINVTANGIAAAAIVTIDSSSNSGSESLTIDTGGTAGTFATGGLGRENYQAAGQGLIENATLKPTFTDSLTGVANGALTLDLNTLFTSPTALSTTISESGGDLVSDVVGVQQRSFLITELASVSVGGTTAGQNLTLDYTNGDPLPSSGLTYDPPAASGNASNSLTLQGGSFTGEEYTARGPGAGSILYDGTKTIAFSNLSPVTDTVASPTFIFTAPATSQTVNVNTGPIVTGTQTDQINDGGTGSFELINFANKTAATVNVPDSGATTTLNIPTPAAGLSSLNVFSGAGGETVNVQAIPAGVTTTADTGSVSGSTINVGLAGSLAAIDGTVFVQSTGGANTLTIDDSAALTPGTYTIASDKVTATTMPGIINFSGGGLTIFNLNSSGGSTVKLTSLVQANVVTYDFTGGAALGLNTLDLNSPSPTPDYTTTPGDISFGPSNPAVHYTNFATVNITKPAISPTGTGVTINATAGQALNSVIVATFTLDPNDLANTSTNFVASINWGDSTPATAGTIVANGTGGYNIVGSHTYTATGTFTINVTLTDNSTSGTTTVAGTTFNVTSNGPVNSTPNPIVSTANVAAAALLAQGTTVSGTAGVPLTGVLVATFMDTGTPGLPSDYTASINWGDGTTNAATSITSQGTPNGIVFSVFGTHTYAAIGTYPLTVTITKTATGAVAIASGHAVISATGITPGTATALSASTGVALAATSIIGTFTDTNTSEPASDFTAVIDWSDGSPTSIGTVVAGTTAGTFDVEATHTYAKHGTYTPTITLTQAGGPTITLISPATATITVTDLAVTGSTKNFTTVEGTNTGVFVLATFTDPNTLATVADVTASLPINGWGDGTPATATGPGSLVVQEIGVTPTTSATNPGAPIFEVLGSHTYAEETAAGTPDPLSVVITTLGGATTTLTSAAGGGVTVADAPITASGTSITGIEGISTGNVIIATFSDANPGATVADYTTGTGSVVVNWGDGSAPQTLPASALTSTGSANGVLFTVTTSHTYAEEGFYQLTVTITDDGGSTASAHGSATIADAALTAVTPAPTVDATEAILFSGEVGSFTDANPTAPITDYRVAIDWGDGTPETVGTLSQPGGVGTAFLVDGTHTYAYSLPLGSHGSGLPGPQNGTYPITIYVNDVGGSELTLTNTANVADVALTVTGNLNPASDSGVSHSDDITNVVQPNFLGTTNQPNATVTLYATASGSSTPVVIGQGVSNANDAWSITSNPALADGSYQITAIAVDSAGQTISNTTTIVSSLVIDTVGPKVTDVVFNRLQGNITVSFQDSGGPSNAGVGLNLSTVSDAANYQLVTVHHPRVGKYRVNVISVSPATTSGVQTATLTINGGKYIRGGWYFFTVRSISPSDLSGVQDIAGNALDGEFYGYFPSGNNVNGGNFVAQLTAIHHVTYAPSSVIGRGTPVSPPGSRPDPAKTYNPITFNPSKLPKHSVVAAAKRIEKQVGVKAVVHTTAAHVTKLKRTGGSSLLAGNTTNTASTRYVLMGALDTHDAALNQLHGNKHGS